MNSRRDFIRKSAMGAASMAIGGLAFSPASYARIRGANDRLNIAFIGCYRRFNAYMDSLPSLTGHLNVAYVCDVDQQRMADAQAKIIEKTGITPRKEEDLRKILLKEMPESIPLSVPVIIDMNTGKNWLEAH